MIALVRVSGQVEPAGSRDRAGGSRTHRIASVGHELADGLRMSVRHRVMRRLMIFVLVTGTAEGVFGTLFAPFVRHVLHGSSQAYGLAAAAQAIGGIAGGLLAASLGQRVRASRLLSAGAVAFGAVDLAIFLYPLGYVAVWPAIAGMVLVGLPGAMTTAGLITLFQRNTGDSYRGRVFGACGAMEGVAIVAGIMAAGYLGQAAGIIPVLAFQGAAYVLAGLGMLAALRGEGKAEPFPSPVGISGQPQPTQDAGHVTRA